MATDADTCKCGYTAEIFPTNTDLQTQNIRARLPDDLSTIQRSVRNNG